MPHEEQNIDGLGLEWVKHPEVKLDHPVTSYQLVLQKLRDRRNAEDLNAVHPREPSYWPSMSKPPRKTMSVMDAHGQPFDITVDWRVERGREVRDRGGMVLNWERPPQSVLDNGTRVLSTGEVLTARN